jgi:hypothetical protein
MQAAKGVENDEMPRPILLDFPFSIPRIASRRSQERGAVFLSE